MNTDVDLFHTVAIVKIPDHLSFSFEEKDVDIQFAEDLDYLNSRKLPRGTSLGRTRPGGVWREGEERIGTLFQGGGW
ncbi:hypothetical protein [Candidatus Vondammii sp. HM_W22]|uniref:hypothetical protein n=1 Tax=Candidatus Vondammii sp. HM_W22 TaxID=2687299 RepID=UPI001F12E64F|nr:hypothetical protein [Candidatus Vondammii sp. HM_W22]